MIMSELTKIRDYYFKLKQHDTVAYIRDAKNYALENFDFVLSVAYEHETRTDEPKKHTIADNYGAGDLSRLEPCVFCEDYEKIESERDAMYEALKGLLSNPLISAYYTSHKDMDMAFAEEVPSYKTDCEAIASSFDTCISALAKAEGK
jgi:hypothetical protein